MSPGYRGPEFNISLPHQRSQNLYPNPHPLGYVQRFIQDQSSKIERLASSFEIDDGNPSQNGMSRRGLPKLKLPKIADGPQSSQRSIDFIIFFSNFRISPWKFAKFRWCQTRT